MEDADGMPLRYKPVNESSAEKSGTTKDENPHVSRLEITLADEHFRQHASG